jgi:hypothetical protein
LTRAPQPIGRITSTNHPTPVIDPVQPPKPYTPEDVRRLQAEFAPVAASYRRRSRIVMYLLSPLLVGIILLNFFPKALPNLFHDYFAQHFPDLTIVDVVVPGFICCLIAAACCSPPDLTCPGCSNNLRDEPADFCPECGARAVEPRRGIHFPRCTACGKSLNRGPKYRNYKVRFCTYCGLKLDDQGL